MYSVEFIKSSSVEYLLVRQIRISVFVNEQGANISEEFDEFDLCPDTQFAVVKSDGKIVGTGRIVLYGNKYKIGRIAILSEYRGQHLGYLLVKNLIMKASEYGAKELFVDAQLHAIPFYQKLGFEEYSDNIIDRGLVHKPMKLDLVEK